MHTMRIFIDTEFTDFINCELISLDMVSENGEELYFEVPYEKSICSEFVHEAVIPLLDQYPELKCSKDELKLQILKWLQIVRTTHGIKFEICFDYQTDWDLFVDIFDGEIPQFIQPRLISQEISELLLYEFWKHNHDLREHRALHDARANAYAFRKNALKH